VAGGVRRDKRNPASGFERGALSLGSASYPEKAEEYIGPRARGQEEPPIDCVIEEGRLRPARYQATHWPAIGFPTPPSPQVPRMITGACDHGRVRAYQSACAPRTKTLPSACRAARLPPRRPPHASTPPDTPYAVRRTLRPVTASASPDRSHAAARLTNRGCGGGLNAGCRPASNSLP